MKIERKFTTQGQDAYASIEFTTTASEIRNPNGTIVFRLDNVEVPKAWSQVAADVIAQKYFRKAGVPSELKRVKEKGVPEFLCFFDENFPKNTALEVLDNLNLA